jgi:lysophospholipase L1-like esterase
MISKSSRAIVTFCITCLAFAGYAKGGVADVKHLTEGLIDSLKIVYFGSSVPFGFGAKNNYGYTYRFTDILNKRSADGAGKAWKTVNKSIGGDNTVRLMGRWRRDFVSQNAKYVLIALSLGNEGIHELGKSKFDQFKTNMVKLIALARDSGYAPVITNCYARNDFNEKDYNYTKQMNLWINTLDVSSVNLLGAIDDGTGKWAPGYWYNEGHPNDAGHQEMAYAIVPSLFDALSNGKAQPKQIDGSAFNFKGQKLVDFKPDNIVHPFTTTITIKVDGIGRIIQLKDSLGNVGALKVTNNGFIEYTSPLQGKITGTTKIADGGWHKITLTHYHARNETQLYCDSTLQGSMAERIFLKELLLGDKSAKNIEVKNWLFYRSGMNLTEIAALTNNILLKSSLELYAPLDEQHTVVKDVLINLAQSTDKLSWVKQ